MKLETYFAPKYVLQWDVNINLKVSGHQPRAMSLVSLFFFLKQCFHLRAGGFGVNIEMVTVWVPA